MLARAPALLDELDDTVRSLTEESKDFSGMLRIWAPLNFGEVYVHDLVRRFSIPHP